MCKKELTINEQIQKKLKGDARKNALDFVAFLRENNCEDLCIIVIAKKPVHISPWTIFFNICDFDGGDSVSDILKQTAWTHAHVCDHFASNGNRCGCGDQPGFRGTMFGKEFENLCKCPLQFTNPGAKKLDHAKKLLLMLKPCKQPA